MSYNVTGWKVKELENFEIPTIKFITDNELEWIVKSPKLTVFGPVEGLEIIGHEIPINASNWLKVTKIDYSGSWSGVWWNSFKELLRGSRGKLIASVVWEEGDMITILTVDNGAVTEREAELV